MQYLFYPLALLTTLALCGQPLPVHESTDSDGVYVFTVFSPTATERPLWRLGDTEMTTHRLFDGADSTVLNLPQIPFTCLRTYFTTDRGAAAGAGLVTSHPHAPAIAELLAYPFLLSPEQRQLTESYLALKHGLTLDQHRPVNYLALARTDGASYPVWTATAEPDFRHRILGLARDDASKLLRTNGSSVLAPELLQLHWEHPPDSTAYLIIADDGAPTARATALDANGLLPLQRRWRVQTTGRAPETIVSIAPRRLFAQLKPGERLLLLADERPVEVSETGERLSFVLPSGTEYFRLAIANAVSHTLPSPDDLFQRVHLSPNPVSTGQPVQLRIALREATSLTLTVVDATGRQLEERHLPAATHQLSELTFPAPGPYALHLRSRQNRASITVIVQ